MSRTYREHRDSREGFVFDATARDWAEFHAWAEMMDERDRLADANRELAEAAIIDAENRENGSLVEAEPVEIDMTPVEPYHPSHDFVTFNGLDYNCCVCDCKPWHRAAKVPCLTPDCQPIRPIGPPEIVD